MKIYKLSVTEGIDVTSLRIISGSMDSDQGRLAKKEEYFYTEEKAKARQSEIYEGIYKLAGFLPSNLKVYIKEIEVTE